MGIQGYSWEYKGIQGYTVVYRGLLGYKGVFRGIQGYTRVCRVYRSKKATKNFTNTNLRPKHCLTEVLRSKTLSYCSA